MSCVEQDSLDYLNESGIHVQLAVLLCSRSSGFPMSRLGLRMFRVFGIPPLKPRRRGNSWQCCSVVENQRLKGLGIFGT